MTRAFAELTKTFRATRKVNLDEELYEREVAQCRFERAMANGSTSH
jgi:hypothetical protein